MNRVTRFTSWAVVGLAVGAASVSAQDLQTMSKNANQWVMTGRTYDLQRYSPLDQISTANVKGLHVAWTMSTGTLRGHEGNPLVVGSTMYLHSSFPNKVYALDLTKPGAPQIWQFTPEQSTDAIAIACCDVVNRGLAFDPKTNRLVIELLAGDVRGDLGRDGDASRPLLAPPFAGWSPWRDSACRCAGRRNPSPKRFS